MTGRTRREVMHSVANLAIIAKVPAKAVHPVHVATPEYFRRDGMSDTDVLNELVRWLGPGRMARIDATYVIDRQIEITDKSDFSIAGVGRIRIADGTPIGYGHSALYFARCRRFRLEDLTCDGNRAGRTPGEAPGHLIVVDSCHEWEFARVRAINGTTDGFFVYTGRGNGSGPAGLVTIADIPSGWVMRDCVASDNFRQGLSIIESTDWSISGGTYSRTSGLLDVPGSTGPCAGIDLEPDDFSDYPRVRLARGRISGVTFIANQGPGLLIANARVSDIVISDCHFEANGKAAISCFGHGIQIRDVKVIGWSGLPYTRRSDLPVKRGAIDFGSGAGPKLTLDGASFEKTAESQQAIHPLVYTHGQVNGPVSISRLRSDGSASAIAHLHAPATVFREADVEINEAGNAAPFVLAGPNIAFTKNQIRSAGSTLIIATASGLRIEDNDIRLLGQNSPGPVFDCSGAFNVAVAHNRVNRDIAAAGVDFLLPKHASAVGNVTVNNREPRWLVAPYAHRLEGNRKLNQNDRAKPRT